MADALTRMSKEHKCKRPTTCSCSIQGLEPADDCPVHSGGEWPPRCRLCGRKCNRYANVARPVCGQCSTLRQHALPPKLKAAVEKCHYCPVFTANGSRVCTRCLESEGSCNGK